MPIDPATGTLVDGDIAAQTRRVLQNIGAILEAAGASFDHVVRTTVFLADMNDFAAMNEVYATLLHVAAPARATVQVARLPEGRAGRNRRHRVVGDAGGMPVGSGSRSLVRQRPARSTSTTPAMLRSDLITFCRCLTSLISTVMSMRPI